MKNQVLSIEQMQQLKELGVDTSKASMCWVRDAEGNRTIEIHDEYCYEMSFLNPVPAFTLQDMLDMMPNIIEVNECECSLYIFFHEDGISVYYECGYDEQPAFFCEDSILESAYNMLCWLAENGYLNKK